MTKNRDLLLELSCDEDIVVFDNYDYDSALIGYTDDGRAVYEYGLMVQYLMVEEDMDELEAMEWIDYNTIRALPYAGDKAPVIMYSLHGDWE